MPVMPLFIYTPVHATPSQFVEFWGRRYPNSDEHLYDNNIGLDLTEQRITELFLWKNGGPLSGKKQLAVRRFVEHTGELKQCLPDQSAADLLYRFSDGGAIWRIFWLHCWQPLRFPIYDQHVHRAMVFIQTGQLEEIPTYDPRKIEAYVRRYLPFHAEFDGMEGRTVDKALWAYGKFLKEPSFPTVDV